MVKSERAPYSNHFWDVFDLTGCYGGMAVTEGRAPYSNHFWDVCDLTGCYGGMAVTEGRAPYSNHFWDVCDLTKGYFIPPHVDDGGCGEGGCKLGEYQLHCLLYDSSMRVMGVVRVRVCQCGYKM
jgi:hypothetical protein